MNRPSLTRGSSAARKRDVGQLLPDQGAFRARCRITCRWASLEYARAAQRGSFDAGCGWTTIYGAGDLHSTMFDFKEIECTLFWTKTLFRTHFVGTPCGLCAYPQMQSARVATTIPITSVWCDHIRPTDPAPFSRVWKSVGFRCNDDVSSHGRSRSKPGPDQICATGDRKSKCVVGIDQSVAVVRYRSWPR